MMEWLLSFRDSKLKTGIITSEKQKWFQTGKN